MKRLVLYLFLILTSAGIQGQDSRMFYNPILPGFNPDPSICRVGENYYLVTSSFTWYPGLPVYHSKDLINWKLIGHGINRPGQLNMDGVEDKNGLWAPTIRFHDGLFYILNTCNTCGGNFYITAKNPAGPWSDPVWLKKVPGIDPSFFWDDDGKCYYVGNRWDNKSGTRWPGQTSVWVQEFDIKKNELIGEAKHLTFGHANNAKYAEGPHLYKINGKYLLLIGEGGTDENHSVTVHHSDSVFGPYTSDQINPVITHRHLGNTAHIQAVGHADLVQTQMGEWWAVLLGKRTIQGKVPLGRETFLCRVNFEGNTPIFNPGHGIVLDSQLRPSLPSQKLPIEKTTGESQWYSIRIPQQSFYEMDKDKIRISLLPVSVDSLFHVPILLQKVTDHQFTAGVKLISVPKDLETASAGMILYRTTNSYYFLAKEGTSIILYKKFKDSKEVTAKVHYSFQQVYFRISVDNLRLSFFYGPSELDLTPIGSSQSIIDLADNSINRFNGLGIGLYASSGGMINDGSARFEDFSYKSCNVQQKDSSDN